MVTILYFARLREALGTATEQIALPEGVRDLEGLVDSPPGTLSAASESVRDRLSDSVRRLEASHPVLSATLGNVIDALAFFGL